MSRKEWMAYLLRSFFFGGMGTPEDYLRDDNFCELVADQVLMHEKQRTWEHLTDEDLSQVIRSEERWKRRR